MSQSSGKRTGLGGRGGGAGATGGVIGVGPPALVTIGDDGAAGLFGGSGKVTVGLTVLSVGPDGQYNAGRNAAAKGG
jgi:hypothetical protein